MPQQAAYDVGYYDLDLSFNADNKSISGSLVAKVKILANIDSLILDLDDPFTVDSVIIHMEGVTTEAASYLHSSGKLFIEIPWEVSSGLIIITKVYYHGSPRISTNPPWDDGFVWEKTPSGKDWIGVACETGGGDIWWPCKDHPSDEPDSMALNFTVPEGYTCVTNGKLVGTTTNHDGSSTFRWFISTPINNYNVTFYVADFQLIEDEYGSVSGEKIPFKFWVLPESYEDAQNHLPVFFNEFHFLETICGPFPFGADKHGWAHAPYWGMEHQTIIAYGHNFQVNGWGLDYIHYHELTHEWWGNLVTAKDWSDLWIHEGLGTYMEALYVEHIAGKEVYHMYMNARRPENEHSFPLAPREVMTASEAFGFLNTYRRGAWVMQTLRFHLGDQEFFSLLKHWAYPDTSDTDNTNGRLCRLATTDDMQQLAEQVLGKDLGPFFNVFFREATYPYLEVEYFQGELTFSWITENNVALDLDVPVLIDGTHKIVNMYGGRGKISASLPYELDVDPDNLILMDEPIFVSSNKPSGSQLVTEYRLYQNFPNPFNPITSIYYQLPVTSFIDLSIYNLLGQKITTLVSEEQNAGYHQVEWNAGDLAGGIYIYRINAGTFQDVKKMVLLK